MCLPPLGDLKSSLSNSELCRFTCTFPKQKNAYAFIGLWSHNVLNQNHIGFQTELKIYSKPLLYTNAQIQAYLYTPPTLIDITIFNFFKV